MTLHPVVIDEIESYLLECLGLTYDAYVGRRDIPTDVLRLREHLDDALKIVRNHLGDEE